jgi:hypothetical protein
MEMAHYDIVPGALQEKIVSASRAECVDLVEVEEYTIFVPQVLLDFVMQST